VRDLVHREKIQLKGRAGVRTAQLAAIDSSEAALNSAEFDIFENTLTIHSEKFVSVERSYFDVCCLISDLPVLSSSSIAKKRPARLSKRTAKDFVADYIVTASNPTLDGLRKYASEKEIVGGRDLCEPEFLINFSAVGADILPPAFR